LKNNTCKKDHNILDLIVKDLPTSQSGFEGHKCASYVHDKGLEN